MQILQTCLDDIFPGTRWCVHKGGTSIHILWFLGGIQHLRNAAQDTTGINRRQLHKKFSAQIAKCWEGHGTRNGHGYGCPSPYSLARLYAARLPGCPACPAIWLILDETNPNFAIFICMYFCEWPTKKFFAQSFYDFIWQHPTSSGAKETRAAWKVISHRVTTNATPTRHRPCPMHTHICMYVCVYVCLAVLSTTSNSPSTRRSPTCPLSWFYFCYWFASGLGTI